MKIRPFLTNRNQWLVLQPDKKNRVDLPRYTFILGLCTFILFSGFYLNPADQLTSGGSSMLVKDMVFIDQDVPQPAAILAAFEEQKESGSAFSLFTHGRSGELLIDGQWLEPAEIAGWLKSVDALASKDQLHVYGCEFAKGEKGKAAVAYLEATLGVSVAASDDVTGVDGDWELEVGEARNVLSLDQYSHNLQDDCSLIDFIYCPPSSPTATDGYITVTNLQTAVPGANFFQVFIRSLECGQPNYSNPIPWTTDFSVTSRTITGLSACKYDISVWVDDNTRGIIECQDTRFGIDLSFVDVAVTSNGPICNGEDLQLSAYLKTGTSYSWSGPNGFSSTSSQPTISGFTSANAGTYSVTVTDGACGNSYTGSVVVTEKTDCNCNCTDYLYVNDAALNIVHKFALDPATGAIAGEIGSPWLNSGINAPHGLVSDLNGNLYIAQNSNGDVNVMPNLNQLSCEGTLLDNMFQDMTGSGLQWDDVFNLVVRGNSLYTIITRVFSSNVTNVVVEMDLCDGTIINQYPLPDTDFGAYWGIRAHEDGIYIVDGGFNLEAGADLTVFSIDYGLTTLSTVFTYDNAGPAEEWQYLGIDVDEFGNFYINTRNTTAVGSPNYIYKFSSSGALIDVLEETSFGPETYNGAYGLEYNNGFVYLASAASCVFVIYAGGENGQMIEIPDYTVPGLSNDFPKAISISRECCPVAANLPPIDTVLCGAAINDEIFLQDFFSCDGAICGGEWMPGAGNTGFTYNSCNSTLTINSLDACGSFTLSSDGTGTNAQCGAFSITVNISVGNVTASIFSENQEICAGDDPDPFTVLTTATGSDDLSFQWYVSTESDSTGFTPIAGATMEAYDATPADIVADTMYFRNEVFVTSCSGDMCQDSSNTVVVITVSPRPDFSVDNFTLCGGGSIDLATLVTNTGGGTLSYHPTLAAAESGTPALPFSMVSPASTTTYYVRSDDGGDCFTVREVVITVVSLPDFSVTNGTLCSGGSIDLATLVNNTGGGTLSYHTTLAAAQSGTPALASSTVSPASATNYYVRSTNSSGCFTVREVTVTLRSTNCGTITISGPNQRN